MSDEPKELTGRARGGAARAAKLTPDQRSDIARKGALAKKAKAAAATPDGPALPVAQFPGELKLGSLTFPCAVLSDGTRVLTEADFMAGLGMYRSGALSVRRAEAGDEGAQMPLYLAFKNLIPFVIKHLGDVHVKPLKYKTLTGGTGHGINATLIPKICSIWLDARRAGVLGTRQEKIADNAEMLLRGLAEVGIVALVDEATGYQSVRAKDALAKILEAFVAKELQPYLRTFPVEYYEHLFRLYDLPYPPVGNKSWRPAFFGHITNDVIYSRLAPDLLPELKRAASRAERKSKLHQWLTKDIGHPKLREHLASIVSILKLSKTPEQFKANVDYVHPARGSSGNLDFGGPT
ncbi:MAG: P63C domain-containing protein [Pseudoxanthomonas sp.]|nr:P63C domain-containing protein [Pseudoxanthomonas sp.]